MDLEKEWDKMNQSEIDQFVEYINKQLINRNYVILQPILQHDSVYQLYDYSYYTSCDLWDKPYFEDVLNKYRNLGYLVQIDSIRELGEPVKTPVTRKWYEFWKDDFQYIQHKKDLKVLKIVPKLEKK